LDLLWEKGVGKDVAMWGGITCKKSATILFVACVGWLVPDSRAALVGLDLESRLNEYHRGIIEHRTDNAERLVAVLPQAVWRDLRDVYVEERLASPWRRDITATIFWVGEEPTENNPTPNDKSAWDGDWVGTFGGVDYPEPERRAGFVPRAFIPRQNPFYVALPYNDIESGTWRHKESAARVIPWFWREYRGPGTSVCHGRWLAIRFGDRVCYAQWRDVGPFETDDYAYVFLGERPLPNRNNHAGIDLSPAVRDYLGMRSGEVVDWRFVEDNEIGYGPWSRWQRGFALPERVEP